MTSKMYFSVGLSRTRDACVTNPIPCRTSIPPLLICKEHLYLFNNTLVSLNSLSVSKSWHVNDCEVAVEYGGIKCVCSRWERVICQQCETVTNAVEALKLKNCFTADQIRPADRVRTDWIHALMITFVLITFIQLMRFSNNRCLFEHGPPQVHKLPLHLICQSKVEGF